MPRLQITTVVDFTGDHPRLAEQAKNTLEALRQFIGPEAANPATAPLYADVSEYRLLSALPVAPPDDDTEWGEESGRAVPVNTDPGPKFDLDLLDPLSMKLRFEPEALTAELRLKSRELYDENPFKIIKIPFSSFPTEAVEAHARAHQETPAGDTLVFASRAMALSTLTHFMEMAFRGDNNKIFFSAEGGPKILGELYQFWLQVREDAAQPEPAIAPRPPDDRMAHTAAGQQLKNSGTQP